jgi:hypothetical protein
MLNMEADKQDLASLRRITVHTDHPELVNEYSLAVHATLGTAHATWAKLLDDLDKKSKHGKKVDPAIIEMQGEMCVDHLERADCIEVLTHGCNEEPRILSMEICEKFWGQHPDRDPRKDKEEKKEEKKGPQEKKEAEGAEHSAESIITSIKEQEQREEYPYWHHEYGHAPDHAEEICKKYPNNGWCKKNLPKSGFEITEGGALVLGAVALVFSGAVYSSASANAAKTE